MLIFPWENDDFYKIAILAKYTKNHRKIIPKTSKNRAQIHPKSQKINKKSHADLRCAKNAKKTPKNRKKVRKLAQHAPKSFQKEQVYLGLRSPRCPAWPPKQPL